MPPPSKRWGLKLDKAVGHRAIRQAQSPARGGAQVERQDGAGCGVVLVIHGEVLQGCEQALLPTCSCDLEEPRHGRVRAGAAPSCPLLLRLRGSQSGSDGNSQNQLQSFIFQRQEHGPWVVERYFNIYLFQSSSPSLCLCLRAGLRAREALGPHFLYVYL
jgi:hypothetical protein